MSVNFPEENKYTLQNKTFSEISRTEDIEESSFFDNQENSYDSNLPQFENSSQLIQVQAQKNSKVLLFGNDGYTFKTTSGVEIIIENPDELGNAQIFENKETGEVFVINAKGAKIKSNGDNTSISIYNSQIESINTKKGNDTINIYDSTIGELNAGRGDDRVSISNSQVDSVETGWGNDNINIDYSEVEDVKTTTSSRYSWFQFRWLDSSSDMVNVENTKLKSLKTGKGKDVVIASDSSIDTLRTKGGTDSVSLNNTQIKTSDINKEDLKIGDGNYLADFDVSKMPKVESTEVITLQNDKTVSVSDYISLIPQQKVGFETESEYQQYVIQAVSDNLESMKQILQYQNDADGKMAQGFNSLKELTGLGISGDDVQQVILEQEKIISELTAAASGESEMSFEEAYEKCTGTKFSTEKIDKYIELSNIASAMNSGCYYDEGYAEKFKQATGKSVEDVNKEFALCQNEILGKSSSLQNIVEKYSASQEGFSDNLSSAISTAGVVCIVAGSVISFIPGGAPIGLSLMNVGQQVMFGGMLVDNGIDLIEHSTDKDGLTKDEAKNLLLETGVEIVAYTAGRSIGTGTNFLNNFVSQKATNIGMSKVASYVAGQASETLADTFLSLGADYAIAQGQSLILTGELMDSDDYWSLDRFTGEGKNQIIGILTGLASSKVSKYSQSVVATAQGKILSGDIDGAKSYLKQNGLGQYAQGGKFKNIEAHARAGEILPTAQKMILEGNEETAKEYLNNNGLGDYTKNNNFEKFVEQTNQSAHQAEIIANAKLMIL